MPFVVLFPLGCDDLSSGEHRHVLCCSAAPASNPCRLARANQNGPLGVTHLLECRFDMRLLKVCCDL
jgi:hypothetical protein